MVNGHNEGHIAPQVNWMIPCGLSEKVLIKLMDQYLRDMISHQADAWTNDDWFPDGSVS